VPCTDEEIGQKGSAKLGRVPPAGLSSAERTEMYRITAPMLFVRPGELRNAEWAEIDLDERVWNIPAHKMKTKQPHLVPLSAQAVAILT